MVFTAPTTQVQTNLTDDVWVTLVAKRLGLQFGPTRVRRLETALRQRLGATGLSAEAYHELLATQAQHHEWQALASALVIGETRFFRHGPSFNLLQTQLIPERLKTATKNGTSKLHLLSAGCANGSEAYSLAMCALPNSSAQGIVPQILGLDLCPQAIAHARAGSYRGRALNGLDETHKQTFFTTTDHGQSFQVKQTVKQVTRFQVCNLHQADSLDSRFDIIYCQNLFIYFANADRQRMLSLFASHLLPHGFLVLGPAEILKANDPRLQRLDFEQTLVFQRKATATSTSRGHA